MHASQTHDESPIRSALIGAACLSLQPLALNILSVPVMAFIIRRLGPGGYGLWTVATALVAVFAMLSSLGLRGAFVRSVAAHPSTVSSALAEQLGLRLVLAAVLGGAAVVVSRMLGYPAPVVWCTTAGAVGMVLTAISSTLGDVLQARHRVPMLATVTTAAGLALTGASVAAAWWGAGPISMAAAYITGPAVSAAMLAAVVSKQVCAVRARFDLRRFRALLAGSRFFAAQQLLSATSTQAESLLLPQLIGIGQFGFFSAGTMLANRLTVLPDGLCTALYPGLVRACGRGASRAGRQVFACLLMAVAGATLIAVVGTLGAATIGRILFPRQPEPFAIVVRVTIWSLPVITFESIMGYALNAAGRDAAQARASIPAAAISLALSVALVSSLGLIGACWSMLIRPAIRAIFLLPLVVATFRPAASANRARTDDSTGLGALLARKAG